MKCKSCESEINPKWKYAIDSNVCPFCGQSVMDIKLKDSLTLLRETIDSLSEYPDQLNDWLLSNYNYIKTDSPDLINHLPMDQLDEWMKLKNKSKSKIDEGDNKKFTVKVQTDHGEEEVMAEKTQSEEKTNGFFKRAEAVKPNIDGFKSTAEKTQRLKSLAQQIKKEGSSVITASEGGSMITPEMIEQASPEAVAEMQSLMSESSTIASSLPPADDDDAIPSVVLAMASRSSGGKGATNAADLLKLQQMQDRVQASKRNFESGENRGKGGFSRSG